MPLYDMLCEKCRALFEVSVPLRSLGKKIKCPECKKVLKRQVSAPKIIKVE